MSRHDRCAYEDVSGVAGLALKSFIGTIPKVREGSARWARVGTYPPKPMSVRQGLLGLCGRRGHGGSRPSGYHRAREGASSDLYALGRAAQMGAGPRAGEHGRVCMAA